ncbi:MAG: S8 family serine peptidase [Bacteroidota bacterium]
MKYPLSLLLALLLGLAQPLVAQQADYQLQLRTGTYDLPDNSQQLDAGNTIYDREVVSNRYYRLLQFNQLPDQKMIEALRDEDIRLLEYLGANTYQVSLPTRYDLNRLEGFRARGLHPIPQSMKLAPDLVDPSDGFRGLGDMTEVLLAYHKDLPQANVRAFCKHDRIQLVRYNGYNSVLRVRLPYHRLAEIAALPYVSFIDNVPGPDVADDTNGRALHRASAIAVEYGAGRQYDGTGVNVLCRDDGVVGPHIDFQGRIFQFSNDLTGEHGDGVSGIMAGAGNLDPSNRGMASGSNLYVTNYVADFLDTTMYLFFNKDVIVTNSSYSNGCNTGYTATTVTVEQQLYENPTLMHVFSAGNSNNTDCDYGAGNQWGNITGGHKQAKNCLTTANLFSDISLVNSSSRGPAHDGRIKPDIAAHGQGQISTDPDNTYSPFGGTSAAAPGIAGITAMLHQAYSDNNSGERAHAALLKAIMLNTANDLGNKGPDFNFGWGHVNALRAAQTIEDKRYFMDTVQPSETNTHTIDIPAGVKQARMMVYWMDPPAPPMSSKALINDLDIRVQDASNNTYMPWILDSSPTEFALSSPATTGVDNLNNVEQVAIDDPQPGTYTLEVEGSALPFGEHDYYVVWEFRMDEITLIYPAGNERLVPGDTVNVYWDAESGTEPFSVEFSVNNGNNWIPIGQTDGDVMVYSWGLPNQFVGKILVRVSRGSISDQSDAPVNMVPLPEDLEISAVCYNSLKLDWLPVNGAISYDIYELGERYMEMIETVTTNSFERVLDNASLERWYAVSANLPNDLKGRRTVAVGHAGGLFNCIAQNDLTLREVENPNTIDNYIICENFEEEVSMVIANNGLDPKTDIEASYRINDGTPVTETINTTLMPGDSINYVFNQQPILTESQLVHVDAWVNGEDELYPFDDTLSFDFVLYTDNGAAIGQVVEDFESGIIPSLFWRIENDDDDETWRISRFTGSDGEPSFMVWMNFFFYNNVGAEDALLTVPVDLTEANEATHLTFDYSYLNFGAGEEDGLRIEVSTDCGATFNQVIFDRAGDDLRTVFEDDVFVPSQADHWAKAAVSLSDFAGQDQVIFRFVAVNDWGHRLFLDNINVRNISTDAPTAVMAVSADEVCLQSTLTFMAESQGDLLSHEWNFGLGASPRTALGPGPIEVTFTLPRPTAAQLTTRNPYGTDVTMQIFNVVREPFGDYTFEDEQGTVSFTSTASDLTPHSWDFGDGNTSTDINPVHTYAAPGDYDVILTLSNACDTLEIEKEVSISIVSIFDPQLQHSVQVMPNPNRGHFDLQLLSNVAEQLDIRLLDNQGRLILQKTFNSAAGQQTLQFTEERLPAGLYFLRLSNGQQNKTLKVIVQN